MKAPCAPPPDATPRSPVVRRPVLVVDDEKRMADSVRNLLRGAGYAAEAAYGGAEAINRIEDQHFPVVITDLRMPGVGGLELIHYLRERQPGTLVIVTTAFASAESAIDALHCHAFDYLTKPFGIDDLRQAVSRAFQKIDADQLCQDTAAMFSHDIKIPLTSIIGFAAMIQERHGDGDGYHPRTREFAETIEANGQKILALVENYLTTCKVESGALQIFPTALNLRQLVCEVVSSAMFSARRSHCDFELRIDEIPVEFHGDEYLLYRAISNLVHNAVKFNCGRREVRIAGTIATDGDWAWDEPTVLLSFENHVASVQPRDLENIFARYRRGSLARGIEGSGIGLYVVRAVAEAHGGDVIAEILDDNNVRFTLRLPMRRHEQIPPEPFAD